MYIWIGFKRVKTKVIEWTDVLRRRSVAFIVRCPECRCKQWAKTDHLYRGFDGTKHNFRCRKCGVGKTKPGDRLRRELKAFKSFNPRNTGWSSIIDKTATPSTADKPSNTE